MTTETATTTDTQENPPRIYVACLAAYNSGKLHGAWIYADQDAYALAVEAQLILDTSPVRGGEEFAIHDDEGFEGFKVGEYTSLEDVSLMARGIVEYGAPFSLYVENIGLEYIDRDTLKEDFEESFQGTYDDMSEFAEQLLEDCGDFDAVPEYLRAYIDVKAFARDLILGGDYWTVDAPGCQVYVFRSN